MYELIIIGGGPAGLAAGIYAARKQLKTLLISSDIGGQVNLTLGVENYLGYQFIEGAELIDKFSAQASQYPIEQKMGEKITKLDKVEGIFEATTESGDKYQAQAIILATGKKPRKLNIPGEKKYTGKGVTYCSICDGPVFSGQRVAVIGGGNSAIEAVLDMVKIAEHVDLVSLTPLTGYAVLKNKLPGVQHTSLQTAKKLPPFTDLSYLKSNGGKSHLRLSISPLRFQQAEQKGHVLIFQDMTEIMKIEEEMKKVEGLAMVG